MAGSDTIELNDGNFKAEVLESADPVLVDFGAEWCGPCRMIAPVIEELATELKGKVKVGKLDTDQSPETAAKYGIMSIPTLLLFQGGQLVAQRVGFQAKEAILKVIQEATNAT